VSRDPQRGRGADAAMAFVLTLIGFGAVYGIGHLLGL
jgi:hypothetical protein